MPSAFLNKKQKASARGHRLSLPPALAPQSEIDEIVEAAIAAAPECVRHRVILPAIDWSQVTPLKVELLLSSLEQACLAVPRWLAKSLLLAGHTLEGDAARTLPASLAALNRLNDATGELDEREPIALAIAMLAHDPDLDPDITAALVRRLMALSWDDDALRLALKQYHHAPHVLKIAGNLFDTHIAKLPAVRLRISGTSTTWMLMEALGPAFAAEDVGAKITEAPFGSALTELLNPPDDTDALVVLLDPESLVPWDWRLGSAEMVNRLAVCGETLGEALDAFAAQAHVPLLVNTLPIPSAPTAGFLDRRHALGFRRAVDLLNARLLEAAECSSRIVLIDADHALAPLAARGHGDPRLWYYGRLAYSADAVRLLAGAFAKAWRLTQRGPAKVLAIDFDNTLWGGVFGDDGIERLACGHDAPGNAFRALQEECLRLRGQGLLLVGLSKNNADALSVFERHPGMALRPEDFAAVAINWAPKPENIRKLAAELNLGLDSFVFLDDSPHEREAMRQLCPEVLVPELPDDPAERPLWLRSLSATWPVRLTTEDETRAALYAVGHEARSAKTGAANLDAYLANLEQRLVMSFVRGTTLARAAQMHQRTNQFNLTTQRLTEAEIARIAADEASGIAVVGKVTDRFGDHGIVVAATVAIDGDEATIRTLLMSCRVIGREIERAFLGALIGALRRRGVRRVRGIYIPTP
ncbi:HAD-IIIC family phosphatase, partial [Hyphomicrobium sp.]|uniref:HAD-IIIC family phosphatase n=1 Tax=Hyphomicrobium sp. TaxID=82 RepID=UPI0025C00C00